MTDTRVMPHGDRPQIEQLADLTVTPVQQVRDWALAHRLDACRACSGFRIEELALAHLISSPDSDWSHQGSTDGSGPSFARAETSRR